ncbi:hypothetical protein V8E53_002873 [Lactarius tabidus]
MALHIEPFESHIFTHGAPPTHPPDRSYTIPSAVLDDNDLDNDSYMYGSVRNLGPSIQDLKDAGPYTNFAVYGTPLEKIYGKSIVRLREIKEKDDPFHVMDLTGGFKFRASTAA